MKVFNYLAKATYPSLILWAMYLYNHASAVCGEEMSMALLVLASIFGSCAIIGIVGKLVLTIIETVKENKAKKNGASIEKE